MKLYYEKYVIGDKELTIYGDDQGVSFIGTPQNSLAEIDDYLKEVTLISSQKRYTAVASYLEAYFNGQQPNRDFNLSLKGGTDLQRAVWQNLLRLPYGERLSYKALAEMVEKPLAIRAVATAVAKNPLLFVIPCHRIIRSDQSIGQYRGGTTLKTELLRMEQENA